MKKDSVYIVMPAYNEEDNIKATVEAWYPILSKKSKKSKLIIADSGSMDSTHEILEKLQANYPQLEVLSNTGKQHGPKLIALYNYAIQGGLIIFFRLIQMDRRILKSLKLFGV